MTEYAQKLQFIAGMMKVRKVIVKTVDKPLTYIGKRKRHQLIAGRKRI